MVAIGVDVVGRSRLSPTPWQRVAQARKTNTQYFPQGAIGPSQTPLSDNAPDASRWCPGAASRLVASLQQSLEETTPGRLDRGGGVTMPRHTGFVTLCGDPGNQSRSRRTDRRLPLAATLGSTGGTSAADRSRIAGRWPRAFVPYHGRPLRGTAGYDQNSRRGERSYNKSAHDFPLRRGRRKQFRFVGGNWPSTLRASFNR